MRQRIECSTPSALIWVTTSDYCFNAEPLKISEDEISMNCSCEPPPARPSAAGKLIVVQPPVAEAASGVWVTTADVVHQGAQLSGLAGRVYLLGQDMATPTTGNGALHVELFNASAPGQPVMMETWDFDPDTLEARLAMLFPSITVEDVKANTGFEVKTAKKVETVPPPSKVELEALRTLVDKTGVLRQ